MLDKTRQHLRENKKVYIAGAVGIAVGAASVFILIKKPSDVNVDSKITQILSWKPKATIEVYIEALGDPGNIIQDTTTGTIYASQGQAAKELGLTPGRISEMLSGKRDHVNGHIFEKLGKAQTSQ